MTGKKPIVKIRVYRGSEVNYNANGDIKNENFLISVEHNTNLWKLTMQNLKLNGYCKVDVDSAWAVEKEGYSEIKDKKVFIEEVKKAFEGTKEVALTPEQKEIAELRAKLEAFMSGGKPKKAKKETIEDESDDEKQTIEDIKKEYEEVVGKKPFHGWDKKTLLDKIEEEKSK